MKTDDTILYIWIVLFGGLLLYMMMMGMSMINMEGMDTNDAVTQDEYKVLDDSIKKTKGEVINMKKNIVPIGKNLDQMNSQ